MSHNTVTTLVDVYTILLLNKLEYFDEDEVILYLPEYWDFLTPYLICPKIEQAHFTTWWCMSGKQCRP